LELDPLSLIANAVVGWFHYFARRYDDAIHQLTKTLEQEPDFARAHVFLGRALRQMAKFNDAIAAFQKGCDLSGGSPGHLAELGHAYGVAGCAEKARAVCEQLMALAGQQYISPYDIAVIRLGLGEFDLAFEWFEKAYQERSFYLVLIQIEPIFDPVRHDPRFRNLLSHVGPLRP